MSNTMIIFGVFSLIAFSFWGLILILISIEEYWCLFKDLKNGEERSGKELFFGLINIKWLARYFLFSPLTIPITISLSPVVGVVFSLYSTCKGIKYIYKSTKYIKEIAFPRKKLNEPGPVKLGPYR